MAPRFIEPARLTFEDGDRLMQIRRRLRIAGASNGFPNFRQHRHDHFVRLNIHEVVQQID
jgi:hypothetical protein